MLAFAHKEAESFGCNLNVEGIVLIILRIMLHAVETKLAGCKTLAAKPQAL